MPFGPIPQCGSLNEKYSPSTHVFEHLWFESEGLPQAQVLNGYPQLMVLFGKSVEPLRGRTQRRAADL